MNWYKKAKNMSYLNALVREIDNVVEGKVIDKASSERTSAIISALKDLVSMNFEGFTKDPYTRVRVSKLLGQYGIMDDMELLKSLRSAIIMGDKVQESLL